MVYFVGNAKISLWGLAADVKPMFTLKYTLFVFDLGSLLSSRTKASVFQDVFSILFVAVIGFLCVILR